MKTFLVSFGMLISAGLSLAQEAAPNSKPPPLPGGVLLNHAPQMSKWVVVTRSPAAAKEPPRVVTYTKTGSILLEENGGQQIWHFKAGQATLSADRSQPFLTGGSGDFFSLDFPKTDFAGLDWISPKTYQGVAKVKGRSCIVFQDSVTPLSGAEMMSAEREDRNAAYAAQALRDKQSGREPSYLEFKFDRSKYLEPATAYIDLETRLPLMMVFGKVTPQTREYDFQPPPATTLVLPPPLAAALEHREKSLSELAAVPASP